MMTELSVWIGWSFMNGQVAMLFWHPLAHSLCSFLCKALFIPSAWCSSAVDTPGQINLHRTALNSLIRYSLT